MHDIRLVNLLGAAALAISDVMLAGVHAAGAVSGSGASALVTLVESPGISVTELGRRVGLSQSAAVRMVDSLEAAGLVRRSPGAGRQVSVSSTSSGRETADRILAARARPLAALVSALDEAERETLTGLLEKLLPRLYGEIGDSNVLCRLCDRVGCTRSALCPVGQAERDRRA
ncbi:MarR family winged helix-turn-helix transcriptional regulator [Nocardia araoensis]|uniref:MarR family winged helix-turn-helix transcriptional regulator n=1 Tax=Nocardia araoensis TaxID=228600 RepID=UPI0002D5E9CE|nr:MarR family transcriptional regulator [Nocardia araoensis]